MAKRWMGLALIAGCLSLPAAVNAQCAQPDCEDPNAGWGPPTCGPLNPAMAPAGPDCDMGIPANVRNAFDHYCGARPDFCCDGMWFSAEYLYLFLRDPRLSTPLVTAGGTGALGAAGSTIALNTTDLDYSGNSGARLSAGFWLDADRSWSVELGGFVTEKRGTNFIRTEVPGGANLFIPFQTGGAETALDVTAVTVNAAGRLWGNEVNMVYAGSNLALLAGWRYLDLAESLDIYGALPGAAGTVHDSFKTRNQFYGGQLGIRAAGCFCNCLFAAVTLKAAIGRNDQSSFTFGEQIAAATITPTGLFVHSTNTGKINDHEFCFVPEGEVRLGYQANRNVFIYVGGTYQYWLKAIRASEQISHATLPIGTNNATGPVIPMTQSDFWAFGASFGFEVRY